MALKKLFVIFIIIEYISSLDYIESKRDLSSTVNVTTLELDKELSDSVTTYDKPKDYVVSRSTYQKLLNTTLTLKKQKNSQDWVYFEIGFASGSLSGSISVNNTNKGSSWSIITNFTSLTAYPMVNGKDLEYTIVSTECTPSDKCVEGTFSNDLGGGSTWLVILLVILGVVLLVGIGLFVYFKFIRKPKNSGEVRQPLNV
jgi:hypothetical protein